MPETPVLWQLVFVTGSGMASFMQHIWTSRCYTKRIYQVILKLANCMNELNIAKTAISRLGFPLLYHSPHFRGAVYSWVQLLTFSFMLKSTVYLICAIQQPPVSFFFVLKVLVFSVVMDDTDFTCLQPHAYNTGKHVIVKGNNCAPGDWEQMKNVIRFSRMASLFQILIRTVNNFGT